MKKLIFIFAILCASALNGMHPTSSFTKVSEDRSLFSSGHPEPVEGQRTGPKTNGLEIYQSLSTIPELQKEIITAALATSNDPDEAIHMIEKLSILRGVRYDNLKNFTALMNILAKKFPDIARQEIAQKFTLPIAQTYLELNDLFVHNITRIKYYRPEKAKSALYEVTKLLNDIDPNYSRISPNFSADNPMQETVLQITFDNYVNAFSKGYTFLHHPHLILIMSALIQKGAKPNADLVKKAEQEAQETPTDSNLQLLKFLTHANT